MERGERGTEREEETEGEIRLFLLLVRLHNCYKQFHM